MNEKTKRLFHKLVELNKRAPGVLAAVRTLAADAGEFARAMSSVEQWLRALREAEKAAADRAAAAAKAAAPTKGSNAPTKGADAGAKSAAANGAGGGPPAPPPPPPAALETDEWELFCRGVERSVPLRALFGSDDWRFSEAEPREVLTLAGLADVAPDRGGELYTQDAAFMSVLELAHAERVETAGQLLSNTLASLIGLIYGQRDAASALYGAASGPHWRDVLRMLETGRRVEGGGEAQAAAVALYESVVQLVAPDARQTLFRDPHLSRLATPELFRLAWESQATFDEALEALAPELRSSPGRRGYQAEAALEMLRADEGARATLAGFEAEMGLRLDLVRHLLDVRQAVKRDALVHEWPEAALLAMSNFESLKEIEKLVVGHTRDALPPPPTAFQHEESYALYDLCKADERLVRYLRLLPRFSEMDLADFAGGDYSAALAREATSRALDRPAPPAPRPANADAAHTKAAEGETPAKGAPAAPGQPPSPEPPADAAPPQGGPRPPLEATIHVLRPLADIREGGEAPDYDFGVSLPGREPEMSTVTFNHSVVVRDIFEALRLPSEGETHRYLADLFRRPDAVRRVTQAGKELTDLLVGLLNAEAGQWLAEFADAAGRGKGASRLAIDTDVERIAALPWEWLTFRGQDESYMLRSGASLVRRAGPAAEVLGLSTPLRVMGVATGPNAQAQGKAAKRMEDVFKPLHGDSRVQPVTFHRPVAFEMFASEALSFMPHVLYLDAHFFRYGELAAPEIGWSPDEGLVVSALVEIVSDAEVQLVVFGDNPTGDFRGNPMLGSVIELMKAGLPAALAPTRFVEDGTSVNFLRNFFGAWLASQTLEASVASARDALRNGRGDWSAFALFAGAEALQRLRL